MQNESLFFLGKINTTSGGGFFFNLIWPDEQVLKSYIRDVLRDLFLANQPTIALAMEPFPEAPYFDLRIDHVSDKKNLLRLHYGPPDYPIFSANFKISGSPSATNLITALKAATTFFWATGSRTMTPVHLEREGGEEHGKIVSIKLMPFDYTATIKPKVQK